MRPAHADLKGGVGGRGRRMADVTLGEPTPSTDPKQKGRVGGRGRRMTDVTMRGLTRMARD
jgi:hypothetical protein